MRWKCRHWHAACVCLSLFTIMSVMRVTVAVAAPSQQLAGHSSPVTTLAASCFACHGPAGNSQGGNVSIAGMPATDMIARMQAFKQGKAPATVMHHHAKGLTDQEIVDLAHYFAALPRLTPASLPAQSFQGGQ